MSAEAISVGSGDSLRILVADDHELVRRGVRSLLESQPGWEVCGEAANGRQAVAEARRLQPDLVVMDIGMPVLNGLEAIRQIKAERPGVECLVLTLHESEQVVHEVLTAGAHAYVLKSDTGDRLITAVRALQEHSAFFTPHVEAIVLAGYLRPRETAVTNERSPSRLTAREREVVQLLAEGKSNKEVATALGVSVRTAETHRTNIMRKLELHSISELVRYAIRNGIVAA
jgi:DNA-binding NarL/FixJ family response regulator